MLAYAAPVRDVRFLLEHVFRYDERVVALPGFEAAGVDVVRA